MFYYNTPVRFQSTLLQEERHDAFPQNRLVVIISIHAPTRGATCSSVLSVFLIYHFNPRSYKRSDHVEHVLEAVDCDFNPRSYKRSDLTPFFRYSICVFISIHAPTRGATNHDVSCFYLQSISIHAPTRGATSSISSCSSSSKSFQSTLLQEERQQKCTIFLMHLCNNYCIVSI